MFMPPLAKRELPPAFGKSQRTGQNQSNAKCMFCVWKGGLALEQHLHVLGTWRPTEFGSTLNASTCGESMKASRSIVPTWESGMQREAAAHENCQHKPGLHSIYPSARRILRRVWPRSAPQLNSSFG
jgi:hypothetical protein